MAPTTEGNIGQPRSASTERTGPLLPDDVLLNICAHIRPDDIYTLSQGSRHFYNIFFPIYLAKNGVNTISGDIRLSRKKLVVLSVLKTSLLLPKIERLNCEFDYPTDGLAKRLDDLKGTLLRIGSLPELTIGFSVESPWCNLQHQHSQYSHEYRVKLRKSLQETMEVVFKTAERVYVKKGKLMAMLLEDAESQHLKAFLGNNHLVKAVNGGGKSKSKLSLKSLLPKAKVKKAKASSAASSSAAQGPVSGPSTSTTSTTSFFLHTPILFGFSIYAWTCDLLSRSTLTHLSIQDVALTSSDTLTWSAFLSKITIPTLTHFAVIYDLIPSSALSAFLNRHPSVHTLHVDTSPSGKQKPTPPEKPEKLALDHVKVLVASPPHLNMLLDSSRSSIPNLKEIGIHVKVEHGCCVPFKWLGELELMSTSNPDSKGDGDTTAGGSGPATHAGTSASTDTIPDETTKSPTGKPNLDAVSLGLQLRAESHLMATNWIGSLPAASAFSPNPVSPIPGTGSAGTTASNAEANLNIVLARIAKIDMDWWQFISPTTDIPIFMDWLATFPALKVLEFTDVKSVESKPDVWGEVLEAVRKAKPDLELKEN